jgi:trypsin
MILLKMKIFTIMTAVLVPSFSNAGAIPPKAFQDPSDISTEIIGGKPVHPPFKYGPWMAVIAKGDYQFCAGTMLTSSILVTAARSSYDAVASFILHFLDCSTVGFPLHTLKVSLHRHNLRRSGKEEGSIDFSVKELHVHPRFSPYTLENDIALWRLEPMSPEAQTYQGSEADLNGYEDDDDQDDDRPPVRTLVRLDDGKHSYPGRQCTVLGWGAVEEGGEASDILQELTIPIVDHDRCKNALGDRIAESMLCAGGEQGKDACQGGSLMFKVFHVSNNFIYRFWRTDGRHEWVESSCFGGRCKLGKRLRTSRNAWRVYPCFSVSRMDLQFPQPNH